MSLISMMEARLPPGFRFHPRDDELVLDYLCRKLSGKGGGGGGGAYGGIAMVDVDLNKWEPWELPGEACVGGREWYFFSLHDRKYATGQRTNRATRSGYWKATGKDRPISSTSGRRRAGAPVGMRKTLVFYQGRAPRGTKTEWVMHEFRVEGPPAVDNAAGRPGSPALTKEDWVLCRVFYKSRTTTSRPPAGPCEAGSLSAVSELIGLPLQHMPPRRRRLPLLRQHADAGAGDHRFRWLLLPATPRRCGGGGAVVAAVRQEPVELPGPAERHGGRRRRRRRRRPEGGAATPPPPGLDRGGLRPAAAGRRHVPLAAHGVEPVSELWMMPHGPHS